MLSIPPILKLRQSVLQLRQRIANRELCHQCRAVLRGFRASNDSGSMTATQQISLSLDLIETSAANGCALCLLFLDGMSGDDKAMLREQEARFISQFNSTSNGTIDSAGDKWQVILFEETPKVLVYRSPKPRDPQSRYVFKHIHFAPLKELQPFIKERQYTSSTASTSSWTVARLWLNECFTEHRLCARNRNTFLPTRLIEISVDAPITLRLCETSKITSGIKYMTLSHCWGHYMPTKLLQGNILSMEKRIKFSDISKTFQDALKITQYFGFRYIWIDSLCIIQDSMEDWQKEAGLMGQVYSNSVCNISATGASDGSKGLFLIATLLLYDHLEHASTGVQIHGSYYPFNPRLWADGVDDAPLNRRAWVVQERLLSPCNLHFGSTQIYWECRQRLACEAYPVALPKLMEPKDSNRLSPGRGADIRESRGLPVDSSLDNYTLWGSIVATYTKGALSYELDKLVALSGIAAELQKVLGDQYLAGLWKHHFADQLLWTVDYASTRTRKSTRPHTYTAPSWSWAAIDGEIDRIGHIRHSDDRGIMIDVLAVHVDLASADPFGQVTGAFLQVKGKLARAAMYVSAEHGGNWSFGVYTGCLLKVDFHIHQDVAFEEGAWISAESLTNLYCLPVRDPTIYPAGDFGVRGLLLQPTGKCAGEFRRFGAFSVFYQKDDALLARACEYFDEQAEGCGLESTDDGENGYKYTITIV